MYITLSNCSKVATLAKKYKHIRVDEGTYKELRKFKNLYELQDRKEYTIADTINLLIRDRISKQFILPITKDKKEI